MAKKKNPTPDRSGLGWSLSDFGVSSGEKVTTGNPNNPTIPLHKGNYAPVPSKQSDFTLGLTGGGSGQQVIPSTASRLPNAPTPVSDTVSQSAVTPTATNAANFVTPEQQGQVQNYLENPNVVQTTLDVAKDWMSNLFDTSDTEKEAVFGLERPWDAMLQGLGWTYDRINQAGSWANSAAPGGIDTFTWDQAGQVSWGQSAIAANAAFVNQAEQAGPVAAAFGFAASNVMNPLGVFGSIAGVGNNPIAPYGAEGFDVLNADQRKAAFEDSTVGKLTSGLTDTVVTLFADPLLFAGKAAKLARVRWVDRPMTVEQTANELAIGAVQKAAGEKLNPISSFADWTTEKVAGSQEKVRTVQEIYNHPVVKRSANRDGLATALHSADNFDEAALVIRYAKGDIKAFDELATRRPDILVNMKLAHRSKLETMMRYNPKAQANLENKYRNTANAMNDELDLTIKKYGYDSPEYEFALSQRNLANENYQFVSDYRIPNNLETAVATKEEVQAAQSAWKQMLDRDKALSKALGDEKNRINNNYYSLELSTKGFAKDNAFGRTIERSRQRRSTAAYQQEATRKARVATGKMTVKRSDGSVAEQMRNLHFWEADEFGHSGLFRAVTTPARIIRWTGNETPSGFITTKGVGAIESTREVKAVLNDVPIYSGPARRVVMDGKEVMVGGLQRKEELIRMYMDAAAEQGIAGAEAAKYAVDRLEYAIAHDIALWHGIKRADMDGVMRQAGQKRDKIIQSLKENGFWVDTKANGQTVRNFSPYLESQLQNGTFMHNWRAMEKAARLYDETPWVKRVDAGTQVAEDKFQTVYGAFNDVWRPAVLMRLGYTQRNVTEGLFRSSAFLFSLDPLKYAGANLGYAVRNAAVKRSMQGAIEEATVAIREGRGAANIVLPKKFYKWQEKQIAAREKNIADIETAIIKIEEGSAEFLPEIRNSLYKRYEDMANAAADDIIRLRKESAPAKEIAAAEKRMADANADLVRIDRIKTVPVDDTVSQMARDAVANLPYMTSLRDHALAQRALLDEADSAVAMFRQQGAAKRRVFDGSHTGPDGLVIREAFDSANDYTDIALMNLSADNTTKSTMSLMQDSMNSIWRAQTMRYYVEVNPGDAGYFQGVAEMLRQFQTSEIGKMVINGDSPQDIALFLRKNPVGRQIAGFVTDSQITRKGSGITFSPTSVADAEEYAQEVINRYIQLAPSPDLQEFLKSNFLSERADMGETVRLFLDRTTATGDAMYELRPAIGNIAELTGFSTVREVWSKLAGDAFRVIGTIPEDAMVRAPFYGIRYRQARDEMITRLKATPGETVTQKEIDAIARIAHRRALKDTKDWLYTIDRRTTLGRTGEYMFPFISAAQNSTTTVGRIIWNDPSIAALLLAAWRAPSKAGFEDEQGNIHIPIPHAFLPDGLEEALGIKNMMDVTINKGSLNVILPESGFGVLPRFGPLVAAPVSEMMKHGWFGMSVEAPTILENALGKEGANAIWNGWKAYAFGEGQGMAPDTLSLSMFTPPVVAKIIQMYEGEGSSSQYAYYYNLQFRNEMANWMAGYRDTPPDAAEIKSRTNGFYMLRIMANLTAFTPPNYESKLDPIIKAVRNNDRNYGIDGSRMSNDQFGNLLLMLGDFSNTKNIGGAQPTAEAVGNARKYGDLIGKVSANLGTDLSVLGMLVNDNPNAYYDDSAYGWELASQIPGVVQKWRELQTPEMAWRESQKNAGWTAYIKLMDGLDAILQERGLESYRSAQASDLREARNSAIEQLRQNPLYAGWYDDYTDFGSTRTTNAVEVMSAALQDQTFMANHQESLVWQAASEYLFYRDKVLAGLDERGSGINNNDNQDIRDFWDNRRAYLINKYNGWGTFANRYLNGDNDPSKPSTTFEDQIATDTPVMDLTAGTIPVAPQEQQTFGATNG